MTEDLLGEVAARASAYRGSLDERAVFPLDLDAEGVRAALGSLPSSPTPPREVVTQLADAIEPALVTTTGPRYFGFVVGGSLDAAAAADVLTTAWDQPAYSSVSSPAAAIVEEVAGGWLKDLLALPESASFGFVTGGQEANTVALAAARHHVLARPGGT